uniref:Copper chaperone PCu(A)C n=1 Tax=Eiseniibacteriota bacterium TaxID=2212470 RepID=A0A832I2Z1_UNCEI
MTPLRVERMTGAGRRSGASWVRCLAGPALASLLSCAPAAREAAGGSPLKVSGAWVRAVPEGAANAAAYMELANLTTRPVDLIGASSPVAGAVELHTVTETAGRLAMRPVARMTVPARGRLILQSGGPHVMLLGLRAPLPAGAHVPLALVLAGGDTLWIRVPVRDGP